MIVELQSPCMLMPAPSKGIALTGTPSPALLYSYLFRIN